MTLLRFLERELRSTPGRFRATMRVLVGCLVAVVATTVLGADILPHGHWTVTTIFTVSQADAGASLRKSMQRIVGTLVGGVLGILVVAALADLPVFYVPLLGAITGFGIFASLTTSANTCWPCRAYSPTAMLRLVT